MAQRKAENGAGKYSAFGQFFSFQSERSLLVVFSFGTFYSESINLFSISGGAVIYN